MPLITLASAALGVGTLAASLGAGARDRQHRRLIVARTAASYLGTRYSMGGISTTAMDCSGLVMQAYRAIGIELPHKAKLQRQYGREVPLDKLKLGDIIYAGVGRVNEHVGIYDGRGGIINASSVANQVTVDPITTWRRWNFLDGARRLI